MFLFMLKKKYEATQMYQIRLGLKENLDLSIYSKKKLDWQQMKEVRLGLQDNLDASVYAKPNFN